MKPKVVGMANWPWVRPIMGVARYRDAWSARTEIIPSRSRSMMSSMALNCSAMAVSTMSLDVAPR